MRLAIRHTTRYRFADPVAHGLQRLRLTPKETQGQQILDWSMEYEGAREELSYEDQHHNQVTLVSVIEGAQEVVITCRGRVQTEDKAGVIGQHAGHLPLWAFLGHTPLTRPGPRIRQLIASVARSDEGMVPTLHNLSTAIREQVAYDTGHTQVDTTAEDAVAEGRGVCQDHGGPLRGMAYCYLYWLVYLSAEPQHGEALARLSVVHLVQGLFPSLKQA
jgi:transglutaminase-like putative cysteine protease